MARESARVQSRRRATLDEIVAVARAELRAGEAVSISSVATALNITPPALYRYVTGLAGLTELVNSAIVDDVLAGVTAAADRQSSAAGKLVAAATALRQWALNNHLEYRSAFTPQHGPLNFQAADQQNKTASMRLSEVFSDYFRGVAINSELAATMKAPPEYIRAYERIAERYPSLSEGRSIDDLWQYERAWVKFLGTISFEAFGFLDPDVVVSGDMFVSIMMEVGQQIGLDETPEELIAIAVDTSDWVDRQAGNLSLVAQRAQQLEAQGRSS